MNKLAKKIAVYATIGTIGAISLTGCGEKSKNATGSAIEVDKDETKDSSEALNTITDDVEKGDIKVFEPYEHLFHVRYECYPSDGNSISIPDGYEVFEINNVIEALSHSSHDCGYDIWFTNKEKVQVEAIYNDSLYKWDYSDFGTIIENDKLSENIPQKVK